MEFKKGHIYLVKVEDAFVPSRGSGRDPIPDNVLIRCEGTVNYPGGEVDILGLYTTLGGSFQAVGGLRVVSGSMATEDQVATFNRWEQSYKNSK